MAKQGTQTVQLNTDQRNLIVINPFELEKKIRKPQPPTTKTHKNKAKYSRRTKHPKLFTEE